MKKLLIALVVALVASVVLAVPAGSQEQTEVCTVPVVTSQWNYETFKTQYQLEKHTRERTRTEESQHYSYTGGKRSVFDAPSWPGADGDWQANTHQEPHSSNSADWIGSTPLHYTGQWWSASWFYFDTFLSDWSEWSEPVPSGTHFSWVDVVPEPNWQEHANSYTDLYERDWAELWNGNTQEVSTGFTDPVTVDGVEPPDDTQEWVKVGENGSRSQTVPCPAAPRVVPPDCDVAGFVVNEFAVSDYTVTIDDDDLSAVTVTFSSETATPSEIVFGPFDLSPLDCVNEFPADPFWYYDDFCDEDGPWVGVFISNLVNETADENDVQADAVFVVDGVEYTVPAGEWEWVVVDLDEDATREVVVTVGGEDHVIEYDADCEDPVVVTPTTQPAPVVPVAAPTPPPAPTPTPAVVSQESLAETGTNPWPMVIGGVLLLILGTGAVVLVRR